MSAKKNFCLVSKKKFLSCQQKKILPSQQKKICSVSKKIVADLGKFVPAGQGWQVLSQVDPVQDRCQSFWIRSGSIYQILLRRVFYRHETLEEFYRPLWYTPVVWLAVSLEASTKFYSEEFFTGMGLRRVLQALMVETDTLKVFV